MKYKKAGSAQLFLHLILAKILSRLILPSKRAWTIIEWKPINQKISTTLQLDKSKKFYRFSAE
ncbi:MAG: hypothetical protein VXY33_03440 [Verrucomicrobiota bacterium]|nr:hypothetical protein [Verrucomicrobiota bacterium]